MLGPGRGRHTSSFKNASRENGKGSGEGFYAFTIYIQTKNLSSWHVSRKLRLRTCILLATLLFEMNIQIKVGY